MHVENGKSVSEANRFLEDACRKRKICERSEQILRTYRERSERKHIRKVHVENRKSANEVSRFLEDARRKRKFSRGPAVPDAPQRIGCRGRENLNKKAHGSE